MTKARSQLIDLQQTPYYHCICRCVRRAFLCGEDHLTGKNYEHRKVWVVERLALLADIFAIDVASFAIMANHYHIVLRVDRDKAKKWDDLTVANHWNKIYSWPLLVHRYFRGEGGEAEHAAAQAIIQTWRQRLFDISWFMRCLNEHLAHRANQEDYCTGRFWEGRFISQALLDDAAVLTCMSYVDLNPIRAGIAKTPETSDHTSVQQRIQQLQTKTDTMPTKKTKRKSKTVAPVAIPAVKLMRLVKQASDAHPNAIGYSLSDYLELVDWAGRSIRDDKRGSIDSRPPPTLNRLGINTDAFLEHVLTYQDKTTYPLATGPIDKLKALAQHWKQKFIKGQCTAKKIYRTA